MFSENLTRHLSDLEKRIVPEQETAIQQSWIVFSGGNHPEPIFHPLRNTPCPPTFQWQQVRVNTALDDIEQMAIQQYGMCSTVLEKGYGDLLNVRCNYGTGIMPSLFGMEKFIMEDETNTLPTVRPAQSQEMVERILEAGIPDLNNGFGKEVWRMGEFFAEINEKFPKIHQFVSVYHPDIQGPLDICELIFGSNLFFALYDRPELVKALLDLACETYTRFLKVWFELHPPKNFGNAHWGMYHRGSIMIRDNSAMNLSRDMVVEFILPYDQLLLDRFNGGAIHFCGKGDHFIRDLANMQHVWAFNITQPELNDMEIIFQNTVDRGIPLLGLQYAAAEEALSNGRDLKGLVHVLETPGWIR